MKYIVIIHQTIHWQVDNDVYWQLVPDLMDRIGCTVPEIVCVLAVDGELVEPVYLNHCVPVVELLDYMLDTAPVIQKLLAADT